MFVPLDKLKYSLSHINSKTWHWRLTKRVFGRKASGKACTYYWFKLPLSILGLACLIILIPLRYLCRVIVISHKWFWGYRFNEKMFDLDESVFESYNYMDYKQRLDYTSFKIAPWEIAMIPFFVLLVLYLIFIDPDLGKDLSVVVLVCILILGIFYVGTRSWKLKPIVNARTAVKNAWDRVCPPLVVEEEEGETPAGVTFYDE